MRKPYLSIRLFTGILALIYFATNVALAHKPETSVWEQRQLAHLPLDINPFLPLVKPVFQKSIPANISQFGSIRKVVPGKSGKTIYYIQDVHMNNEAQTQIGRAVDSLVSKKEVGLVALEGAFDSINLSRYRNFPDAKIINDTADYLLDKNMVSGPVAALMRPSPFDVPPIIGVDDEASYNANVKAYQHATREMPNLKFQLTQWERGILERKTKTFNAQLIHFDNHVTAYRKDQIGMGEYLRTLAQFSPDVPLSVSVFLEAYGMEKDLNFTHVESERSEFLKALVQKMGEAEMKNLFDRSVAYRLNQVKPAEFFAYLKNLSAAKGVPLSAFPAMRDYIQYVLLSDSIDDEALFSEVQSLEKSVYVRLAGTEQEKNLINESRAAYLTGRLTDFALTPEEWSEYQAVIPAQAGIQSLHVFEQFYELADLRSSLMVANLLSAMNKKDVKTAVLVTGGFHTPQMAKQLKDAGITTILFTPKLSKVESGSGTTYLSVFAQEKTPLDQLFKGEKLFLANKPTGSEVENAVVAGLVAETDGTSAMRVIPSLLGSAVAMGGIVVRHIGSTIHITIKAAAGLVVKAVGAVTAGRMTSHTIESKQNDNALWKAFAASIPILLMGLVGLSAAGEYGGYNSGGYYDTPAPASEVTIFPWPLVAMGVALATLTIHYVWNSLTKTVTDYKIDRDLEYTVQAAVRGHTARKELDDIKREQSTLPNVIFIGFLVMLALMVFAPDHFAALMNGILHIFSNPAAAPTVGLVLVGKSPSLKRIFSNNKMFGVFLAAVLGVLSAGQPTLAQTPTDVSKAGATVAQAQPQSTQVDVDAVHQILAKAVRDTALADSGAKPVPAPSEGHSTWAYWLVGAIVAFVGIYWKYSLYFWIRLAIRSHKRTTLIVGTDFASSYPTALNFLQSGKEKITLLRGLPGVLDEFILDPNHPKAIGIPRKFLKEAGIEVPENGILNIPTADDKTGLKEKIHALAKVIPGYPAFQVQNFTDHKYDVLGLKKDQTIGGISSLVEANMHIVDLKVRTKDGEIHVIKMYKNLLVITDEVEILDVGPDTILDWSRVIQHSQSVIILGETPKALAPAWEFKNMIRVRNPSRFINFKKMRAKVNLPSMKVVVVAFALAFLNPTRLWADDGTGGVVAFDFLSYWPVLIPVVLVFIAFFLALRPRPVSAGKSEDSPSVPNVDIKQLEKIADIIARALLMGHEWKFDRANFVKDIDALIPVGTVGLDQKAPHVLYNLTPKQVETVCGLVGKELAGRGSIGKTLTLQDGRQTLLELDGYEFKPVDAMVGESDVIVDVKIQIEADIDEAVTTISHMRDSVGNRTIVIPVKRDLAPTLMTKLDDTSIGDYRCALDDEGFYDEKGLNVDKLYTELGPEKIANNVIALQGEYHVSEATLEHLQNAHVRLVVLAEWLNGIMKAVEVSHDILKNIDAILKAAIQA